MNRNASHNWFIYPFFKYYAIWKIRNNFQRVHIIGEVKEEKLPVLIISNHFSWWDGFWLMYLNLKLFDRRFWFMMNEEHLAKHPFFNKTGGYPVAKGKRSIIDTIKYTAHLLSDPENFVFIFPQGEIESMHTREFRFEKGIEKIVAHVKNDIQTVLVCNLVEYFSEAKPSLYIYLKGIDIKGRNAAEIEKAYSEFHKDCINSKR